MKYLLTFSIEMDAFDDLEARSVSLDIAELTHIMDKSDYDDIVTIPFSVKRKLQEIRDNAPPRKIEF